MSARDDRIECVMRPAVLDRLSPRENPALLHGLDRSAVPAEEHEVGFGGLRREEHVENVRAQLAQRGLRPDDLRVTRSLAALCAYRDHGEGGGVVRHVEMHEVGVVRDARRRHDRDRPDDVLAVQPAPFYPSAHSRTASAGAAAAEPTWTGGRDDGGEAEDVVRVALGGVREEMPAVHHAAVGEGGRLRGQVGVFGCVEVLQLVDGVERDVLVRQEDLI